MTEITIYLANDGMVFNDAGECCEHEMKVNYPQMDDIEVFDKNGRRLENPLLDSTYDDSHTVIIHNEAELEAFKVVMDYCGWCEWETIKDVGIWTHNGEYGFDLVEDTIID